MARQRTRGPIWTRPAPGARRPKLSRDQIAKLALAIADAEGFEAVSMRRLATELDVGTMTLYYYVRTKEDLVALMDDALMSEVVIPRGELPKGWRAGIAAVARRSHDAFLRHPWALRALDGVRLGPNGMRHMEQSLAVVGELAVEPAVRCAIIAIVDDYVFGHALRAADGSAQGPYDAATVRQMVDFTTAQLATGDYPNLRALMGDDDPLVAFAKFGRWMSADQRFERGLEAILDGIEHSLRPRPRTRRSRRA